MNKIDRKFLEYHSDNPQIYDSIVRYARQLKAAGRTTFGIGAIVERIRWDYAISTKPDEKGFKISNDYRSRYSRLVMINCADLRGFFKTKQLEADSMYAEVHYELHPL